MGKLPACVGVPDSVLLANASPAGRAPVKENAYEPVPPVAANDCVYGTPVEPLTMDALPIVHGVLGGGAPVRLRGRGMWGPLPRWVAPRRERRKCCLVGFLW